MTYDIQLVDIGENVENAEFTNISKADLDALIMAFKCLDSHFLIFTSNEGNVILERKYFRGLYYTVHIEPMKTTKQENLEASEIVGPVEKKGLMKND